MHLGGIANGKSMALCVKFILRSFCLDVALEVSLAVVDSEPLQEVNATTNDVHHMLYHSMNVSEPVKPVLVSVYPQDNQSLQVLVQLDEKPTPDSYYLSFQVDNMFIFSL